jgi:hypothetical protein
MYSNSIPVMKPSLMEINDIKAQIDKLPESYVQMDPVLKSFLQSRKKISSETLSAIRTRLEDTNAAKVNREWGHVYSVIQRIRKLRDLIVRVDNLNVKGSKVEYPDPQTRWSSAWEPVYKMEREVFDKLSISRQKMITLNKIYKRYRNMQLHGVEVGRDSYDDVPF